jgi:class 3 adenylate cyclase
MSLPAAGEGRGDRHARLSAAAPPPLIEKMRSARLTGELKPVTALFADVVGSTALAEQMDPEDWTQLINGAFDVMSRAIFRYEGTIAQLQGDALLAFFGAPVAHEDDPERAVRAALDMVAETAEFARQLKAAGGVDFRIRAGINTGPVLVGNVGSDLRYEYTALGDAVNVAARVQTAAEPGSVLITAATQRFVGATFELEDLGTIDVKGKSEPLHVYRAIGLRADPGERRGLASVGLSSPLVGRRAELEALTQAWRVVRAGRGRAAVVIGEPGIGKSRLLAELRAAIAADHVDAAWIEARCASYGQTLPYHLLLDLVRAMLQLPFGSAPDIRAQFDRQLAVAFGEDPDVDDIRPFLAHLLDLPLRADEAERTTLSADELQSRYSASIHRLLRAISARQPVVLLFEDVHWADAASVTVLRQLLPLAVQLPVLILVATRRETEAIGWQLVVAARNLFGEALTELILEPLSDEDSRDLVANLLMIESLPPQMRDLILARTEGNPFFVEEVVRMLIERGVIQRRDDRWAANEEILSVDIPETLHGLLLARIDQLPESAKRSLKVAAVIGRQFPVRVLERVLREGVSETA